MTFPLRHVLFLSQLAGLSAAEPVGITTIEVKSIAIAIFKFTMMETNSRKVHKRKQVQES